jgi:hypothetical protein
MLAKRTYNISICAAASAGTRLRPNLNGSYWESLTTKTCFSSVGCAAR